MNADDLEDIAKENEEIERMLNDPNVELKFTSVSLTNGVLEYACGYQKYSWVDVLTPYTGLYRIEFGDKTCLHCHWHITPVAHRLQVKLEQLALKF